MQNTELVVADLYEAAFLLTKGAKFGRVLTAFRNAHHKVFATFSLTDVSPDMIKEMHDKNATVHFAKFKYHRQRVKEKVQKYMEENGFGDIDSKTIYKTHREVRKVYKELMKSAYNGPKRIIPQEGEEYDDPAVFV
jgi:hypothetical protein